MRIADLLEIQLKEWGVPYKRSDYAYTINNIINSSVWVEGFIIDSMSNHADPRPSIIVTGSGECRLFDLREPDSLKKLRDFIRA